MDIELIYAFTTIGAAALLVIMVLLGGDVEADVDVDVDADVDFDVDADVALAGPGHFGLKLLLGFIIGFSLAGYLAMRYSWPIPHYICGLIGGIVVYTFEYQALKLLYGLQANTQVASTSLVGETATVTKPIRSGSVGEIRAIDPKTGHSLYLRARASDGTSEFSDNADVTIKSVSTGLASVE